MLKLLANLLGARKDKSIYQEIRELIKGKEEDPQKIIDQVNQVNALEAQHRSVFVAGWRPFIGWICGIAFGYHYILLPFAKSIAAYNGIEVEWPVLETDQLFTVLMGMLGLGGLRTYEKLKEKTR